MNLAMQAVALSYYFPRFFGEGYNQRSPAFMVYLIDAKIPEYSNEMYGRVVAGQSVHAKN